MLTPITTLIREGVKLSELLSPTPSGSTTWTVPAWDDVELVLVVVDVVVLVEERVVEVVMVEVVEELLVEVLEVEVVLVLVLVDDLEVDVSDVVEAELEDNEEEVDVELGDVLGETVKVAVDEELELLV